MQATQMGEDGVVADGIVTVVGHLSSAACSPQCDSVVYLCSSDDEAKSLIQDAGLPAELKQHLVTAPATTYAILCLNKNSTSANWAVTGTKLKGQTLRVDLNLLIKPGSVGHSTVEGQIIVLKVRRCRVKRVDVRNHQLVLDVSSQPEYRNHVPLLDPAAYLHLALRLMGPRLDGAKAVAKALITHVRPVM